ncbi:MAG: helix-turn-helix transcriptional regulator [Phycisphaerae bacterium]|nr:helix-turn-helix transcriptional regulator [Phycisphaerae bacterium]
MAITEFGNILKKMRLRAGFGLRRFAEMVDLAPSNLSAIEHGRRPAPASPEKLREISDALGLVEDTEEWRMFYDSAAWEDGLPADVRNITRRKLVPALLRTIDNRQLGDDEIANLIDEIEKRYGGAGNDTA